MSRGLFTVFSLLIWAGIGAAQTVEIRPDELVRIPVSGVGSGRYWQQLVITLDQDDAPSDSTVSVALPAGIVVADTDSDDSVVDEVRVMYAAVGSEEPGFLISPASTAERIVVRSSQPAAAGGRIFLQFPVFITAAEGAGPPVEPLVRYRRVEFADERENDLSEGPTLTLVSQDQFSALSSMDVVILTPVLVQGTDTTTTALGTYFPEADQVLVQELPDLVFDGGEGRDSNLLGFGDGDDANDVEYRFFFSTSGDLSVVDESVATPARTADEEVYVEPEGEARAVRLLTRDLPAGTYFLYVTSPITGSIPLARSRALAVRHEPVIEKVGPLTADITLDSGGLFDVEGNASGQGQRSAVIEYAVVDHDDDVLVHLFYSASAELEAAAIQVDAEGITSLEGGTPITGLGGLQEPTGSFTWNILEPQVVPAGNYFIYAAASDAQTHSLLPSPHQVRVRHAPFLRLDALDDRVLSGEDTITTGGPRPQRFVTFTWGRSGFDGDGDVDDDARISLYYSTVPVQTSGDGEGFVVPGGADSLLAAVGEEADLIVADIAEDPDRREDNQTVWDLWSLVAAEQAVPAAGQVYYVYGIIEDEDSRQLAQMNGGRLNDAGARLVFAHPPTLRPMQPVANMPLEPGQSIRVAWEDMDMDDDARIRVILSQEDNGDTTRYAQVISGAAFVVNSADGQALATVDTTFDLSEDSQVDHLDVRIDHISGLEAGEYFVYLAITETGTFDAGALAWRAPGLIQIQDGTPAETAAAGIQLRPEAFSTAAGGTRQAFEVRAETGGHPVDLVRVNLKVDGLFFDVVDQDAALEGVQPFVVGAGFSAAKLVTNQAAVAVDESRQLTLEYFEPTAADIPGLDGDGPLATFELVSLAEEGTTTIDLEVDAETGRVSRLERDGQPVIAPEAGPVSTGQVVAGRAVVRGRVELEGRADMSAGVDFSLRRWARYIALEDDVFAAANDGNAERAGVQVQLAEDGSFELTEVPTGRLDLHVHLDGYLDAWAPGLALFPGQPVEGVQPGSSGSGGVMLGGDVAGYADVDGQNLPDNEVTLADWDFVASFFGEEVAPADAGAGADITGDGVVDIRDLSLVGANFLGRGPRPVYKPLPRGEARLETRFSAAAAAAGQEVDFTVVGEGLEGVRAYELELLYNPDQWQVVQTVPGGDDREVLMAHKARAPGWRTAAALRGRERDFSGEAPLLTWKLRALGSGAPKPRLRPVLLLDQQDRAVAARVVETEAGGTLPRSAVLRQNFPNPFNPATTIPFVVPARQGPASIPVRLEIFDALGQRVSLLWDGSLAPGEHRMAWDGRDQEGRPVSSGIYLYRLRVGAASQVKRMVLIR